MFRYLISRGRFTRLLFFLPVLFLTTGCSRGDSGLATSGTKIDNGDDKSLLEQPAANKTVVVDGQRCTGCGKCSRFDPEHFSFDSVARKAVVISQDNLESDNLRFAISACQDRAIALK